MPMPRKRAGLPSDRDKKRMRTAITNLQTDSRNPWQSPEMLAHLAGSLHGMTALERRVNMTAVLLPFVVVAIAVPLLWGNLVGWSDVAVFTFMYVISGFGVTVPRQVEARRVTRRQ